MRKRRFKNKHPGDGYYYVQCDVCGFKIRAKDAILVKDKWNLQNGLVVCKADADKPNPQLRWKAKPERDFRNPQMIRPDDEPISENFTSNPAHIETGSSSSIGSRTASAARYFGILSAEAGDTALIWISPLSSGSAPITGYKIERESPVGGGFSTINSNTGSGANYYVDTTTSPGTVYNYRVTPITVVGEGAVSEAKAVTTSS